MSTPYSRGAILSSGARLQAAPVRFQVSVMRRRPLLDEPQRRAGLDGTRKNLPVERECCLLALVLSMEVSDAVLAVEHADDDAEEDRDDRHPLILPLSQPGAYNRLASLT